MDPLVTKQLKAELRKLEKQARQLLFKMERVSAEWNYVKDELKKQGHDVPRQLQDVLYGFANRSTSLRARDRDA